VRFRSLGCGAVSQTQSTLQPSLRLSLALFAQQVDTNRPFQFQKRRQLFIGSHNQTPSVVAVRVNNPDRSPLGRSQKNRAVLGSTLTIGINS